MAKVRREGTVYYDKERKSYRAAFFTPEGKRMIKRFADEQAAKNWLVEQQNSINKGLFVEPDDITLGQWLIVYFASKNSSLLQKFFLTHMGGEFYPSCRMRESRMRLLGPS